MFFMNHLPVRLKKWLQLGAYFNSVGLRPPKGVRAPELRSKKCRAPGLQDGNVGALGLHCFTPGLHLAKNSIFIRAPSRERLWALGSTTKMTGLQGSKDPPSPTHPPSLGLWGRAGRKWDFRPFYIVRFPLRTEKLDNVQWNPVNTDTKGTCHSVRIKRALRKKRHGHMFYRYKD